jgi:histidine triad (HIT) family protein
MKPEEADCFVCRKHRGEVVIPGGAIFEDDLLYCGHAWSQDEDLGIYLGACIVEPKRHVASWADLNDEEGSRIGITVRDVAKALKECEGADHVYVFVLGHNVPHLHIWVVPRYSGTPREYWGLQLFDWPNRPVGTAEQVEQLCARLRRILS